ncbi:metal-dependent hydrolase [Nakamurella sp.]|uniref:metal-dependent hydrolase n=1 Tax=Nakamurella sp. TaxID=1869182 RepID=UPI003B3A5D92
MTPTLVTFPGGSLVERATVRSATLRPSPDTGATTGAGPSTGPDAAPGGREDRLLVVTDRTPFHPVDPGWPDQGPDRGILAHGDRRAPVLDCVIGATDGHALFVGSEIPVRRGEPGWSFVVVHVLAAATLEVVAGDEVTLTVDAGHRAALSAGHTGCHLAALALNAALAGRWRKTPRPDGLGRPDFDGTAIVTSRIEPFGSVDEYRLGRSLRRSGFDPAGLADELPAVAAAVDATLAGWVAAGGAVRVETAGPALTDRREWVCELPDGIARIPCGGTHVTALADLGSVRVTLDLAADGQQLTMRTTVGR